MLFLFDRNMPEKLARMLDHFDRCHRVIWHDDKYERTTADTEWLQDAASWPERPAIISGDARILTNPAEAQVLASLPLTFFHFVPAWFSLGWPDMAWKAVKIWPEIVANATPRRPTIWRVPVTASKLDLFCPTAELGRFKGRRH